MAEIPDELLETARLARIEERDALHAYEAAEVRLGKAHRVAREAENAVHRALNELF